MKQSIREQFEKERIKELGGRKNYERYYQSTVFYHLEYEKHLETLLIEERSRVRELEGESTDVAIMLIREYALCPDEKLTGCAKKLKHRIIEAMKQEYIERSRVEKLVVEFMDAAKNEPIVRKNGLSYKAYIMELFELKSNLKTLGD